MEKKIAIVVIVLTVLSVGIFRAGMVAGAATSEAGSSGDPLITKSYLDERLASLGDTSSASSAGTKTSADYKKITLSKGNTLYADAGTEVILYTGNAKAVSNGDGIINVTKGELTANGISLGKYCSYLIPASQSGINAISECVVFVKGGYTIK